MKSCIQRPYIFQLKCDENAKFVMDPHKTIVQNAKLLKIVNQNKINVFAMKITLNSLFKRNAHEIIENINRNKIKYIFLNRRN
ncbi:unnamed protein product [Paramecium sonneborni]|uniref:Uncharacterized protein n=1 Tax=Paramecium sonneborni TaxID=65129 RepID=A0A8S1QX14_9CILI|nr:unnamed protein product [Paramecium sonneborni]